MVADTAQKAVFGESMAVEHGHSYLASDADQEEADDNLA